MPESLSYRLGTSKLSAIRAGHIPSLATRSVLIALPCLLLTGCGNDLAHVGGVVTLDGKPLQGEDLHATIYFQSTSGNGASGVGILDEQGNYFLTTGSQKGVEPGEYVVTFSASRIIPSDKEGALPTGKRITDPRYASAKTSGIRFDVKEGNNQCDISLESPKMSHK